MVTDNAANITAAVRLLQYQHIPCFAHTLNIIVQKSLSHINIVHKKLKAVVQFFKHSPQATLKLINLQTQLGNQKPLKLKQGVATRWNSTLEMFERIVTIKESLQSALAITNCNIRLSEEDLTIINWTCKVLKPFKIISEELSSEKAVTISKVMLFRKMLLDYIKNIDNQSTTIMPTEIINVCQFIINQLEQRLSYIKSDFIYADATFIDPRFKKARFMNEHKTDEEDALFESTRQRIIQKVEAMIRENQPEVEYNDQSSDQPMEGNDDVIWHVFDSTVRLGQSAMRKFCGLMDLPKPVGQSTYDAIIRSIHSAVKTVSCVLMKEAVAEEKIATKEKEPGKSEASLLILA
ncbi:zinc finger BED domain-containing protein 4-like [Onthophagus taurus]|uniref:zinc finger BED domain-containing protein 4-like n=1 Tax=Onthophagus taurus TaxID=166361 RepID=UPI0039BDA4A3